MNFDHVVLGNHHRHASHDFVSSAQGDFYFDSYDHAMEAVRLEADIQDCYGGISVDQQNDQNTVMCDQQAEEPQEDDDDAQSAASAESYNNDALLYLIMGVQSYISEMSNNGLMNERDSPLFELQYKMYTYMKQRACEMGFDVDSLPPPPQ